MKNRMNVDRDDSDIYTYIFSDIGSEWVLLAESFFFLNWIIFYKVDLFKLSQMSKYWRDQN